MNATAYPAPRLFPTESGAHQLGMSQEMLRYRIRQGQVRAVRIGRRLYVPASEIDRLAALGPVEEQDR
jgi:Helix-turn-helix domain